MAPVLTNNTGGNYEQFVQRGKGGEEATRAPRAAGRDRVERQEMTPNTGVKRHQAAWDKLRGERDALAALIETVRNALLWEDTRSGHKAALAALTLPNTAAAILRQRDARTLREAAEICRRKAMVQESVRAHADSCSLNGANHAYFTLLLSVLAECSDEICKTAAELEAQHG